MDQLSEPVAMVEAETLFEGETLPELVGLVVPLPRTELQDEGLGEDVAVELTALLLADCERVFEAVAAAVEDGEAGGVGEAVTAAEEDGVADGVGEFVAINDRDADADADPDIKRLMLTQQPALSPQ